MNLFETTLLTTPLLGGLGGLGTGLSVGGAGPGTGLSAFAVGVALGIGLLATVRMLAKADPRDSTRRCPEWLAIVLVVFVLPLALPAVAFFTSRWLVSASLHL